MEKEAQRSLNRRTAIADVVGNNLYGLIVGGTLDYFAGLDAEGIAVSRLSGAIVNTVTGAPYGWWREKVCQITGTNKSSGKLRKGLADLLAFNTFQTPLYSLLVGIGSKVSEGEVEKWSRVFSNDFSSYRSHNGYIYEWSKKSFQSQVCRRR